MLKDPLKQSEHPPATSMPEKSTLLDQVSLLPAVPTNSLKANKQMIPNNLFAYIPKLTPVTVANYPG